MAFLTVVVAADGLDIPGFDLLESQQADISNFDARLGVPAKHRWRIRRPAPFLYCASAAHDAVSDVIQASLFSPVLVPPFSSIPSRFPVLLGSVASVITF